MTQMAKAGVEFKFYEEYNRETEKTQTKWTSLDGKELQQVLDHLQVKIVMEAVGHEDPEGINELWNVGLENNE